MWNKYWDVKNIDSKETKLFVNKGNIDMDSRCIYLKMD